MHMISFNAARGFVGGAANINKNQAEAIRRFNAARGFAGGAATARGMLHRRGGNVSMPHAALRVVQQSFER